jgi:hypothetical protein
VLDLVEGVDRVVELDSDEAGWCLRRSPEQRVENAREPGEECADGAHDLGLGRLTDLRPDGRHAIV